MVRFVTTMEDASIGSTEKAAFDEILVDLRDLILSLDNIPVRASKKRRKSPEMPVNLLFFGKNYSIFHKEIAGAYKGDTSDCLQVELRHDHGKSGHRNCLGDNVIAAQTRQSNTAKTCDLLQTYLEPLSKDGYHSNTSNNQTEGKGTINENEKSSKHQPTEWQSEVSEQFIDDNKSTEYLTSDAGNHSLADKAESNPNSPDSVEVENVLKKDFKTEKQTDDIFSNKEDSSHSREISEEEATGENIPAEESLIRRSSPVIGRKFNPSVKEGKSVESRSATLESRPTKRAKETEQSTKLAFAYRTLPYQTRTQSLRRAITKKFGPFKKAKPKLKTVRSLPTRTQPPQRDSKVLAEEVRPWKDRSKNLRTGLFFLSSKKSDDDSRIPSNTQRENVPSDRRAASLDDSASSGDMLDSEYAEEVFHSMLCYKAKKGGRKPERPAKLFLANQHEKERKSAEEEMNNSHDNSNLATNDKPRRPKRAFPTSASLTNIFATSETDRLPASNQELGTPRLLSHAHMKHLDDPDNPGCRRSTIGSSYVRETGASTPNIYRDNSTGSDRSSVVGQYRHSLHVCKEQNAISATKNENGWSAEDGLPKGTSLPAHLQTPEMDRSFKGSFKAKFPKSTKSASKNSSMSSAGRSRLSERAWNSLEACEWTDLSGQKVRLEEIDLLSLSESECVALQKVAEQRLRDIDLGVSIAVPKDDSKLLHWKHNNSVLRRFHGNKTKSKKDRDHVFSIPLVRVVENDQLLRLQTVDGGGNDDDSLAHSSSEASPKSTRRKSSSQDSSVELSTSSVVSSTPTAESADQCFPRMSSPSTPPNESPVGRRKAMGARTLRRRGAVGLDTDTEIDPNQKKVLESLESSTRDKKRSLLPPTMPQVPYVVQKCCAHILKHGLDVTGIFRIAGSKKRVKQLREEFDHGVDVKIDEDYHAHDVAALLKEFIRDLPEALLTRELYQAFISTAKLWGPQQLSALRCLVWLLPMPNRDTLQQLLSFLATVAEHSEDKLDSNGKTICGNKMSVSNLSVIFGPNLLHRYKKTGQSSNDAQYQVQSIERAEESTFVIKIVIEMIRRQHELFMIPRETHDDILRTLQETDPHAVDFLLRRKAANYNKSPTTRTSTERPDDGESASEGRERSPPATENGHDAPRQSDVNNNKNNNNHRYEDARGNAVNSAQSKGSCRAPRDDNTQALYETSFSRLALSPPSTGSISFTDEDLRDILHVEDVSSLENETGTVGTRTKDRNGVSNATIPREKATVRKDRSGKAETVGEVSLNRQRKPAFQFQHHRRQAFSVDRDRESAPKNVEYQKAENAQLRGTCPANRSKVSNRNHRSPIAGNSPSSTSGFVDMSSASSEMSSSRESCEVRPEIKADPWILKAADRSKQETNGEANASSVNSSCKVVRKRPSALNVWVNRTHGNHSSAGPPHFVRIPKNHGGREATKETRDGGEVRTRHAEVHKGSKDDMYLSLPQNHRRQEDLKT